MTLNGRPSEVRDRTLAGDLEAAARIGATGEGGTSRFAWTEELARVTAWVAEELERLGLETEVDAAGNLIGRWDGPAQGAVMAGSHLDTAPNGGAFDGVLGVLGAVEAVRILRRSGFEPRRPVWIGAFMDEEGSRFGTALFGSRAFAGEDVSSALGAVDRDGISVAEAMATRGFDPARVHEADRAGELAAYLELHVEQGGVLEASSARLGLVTSICGVMGYVVTSEGEANHAGTTPMEHRRDALTGAARIVLALRDHAAAHPGVRATAGRIGASPGAFTVIPERCSLTVDLRAAGPAEYEALQAWLPETVSRVAAEEGLTANVERRYSLHPAAMDETVSAAIRAAAQDLSVEPLEMWSGAGHDAMVIARRAPVGMLFVPSRGGISHSPHEWTDPSECQLGAEALAGAIRRLAC